MSTELYEIGRRASDAIALHCFAVKAQMSESDRWPRRWVALRLSDGGSDGVLYDTRRDAIRHQLHEQQCCYVQLPRDGMPPEHAERYIALHRKLYEAGYRLIDPDDEREPIFSDRLEDFGGPL